MSLLAPAAPLMAASTNLQQQHQQQQQQQGQFEYMLFVQWVMRIQFRM
jgi:hypothetical protein